MIASGLPALALAVVLAFVPAAGASLVQVGSFPLTVNPHGNEQNTPPNDADPAGIIFSASSAAVNANGSGGASPGDVYVADQGGGAYAHFGPRISQFTSLDEFVRLWGPDVVKGGPDNSNEVQAVRVDATGGSFKLSFGADTTADLSASASAAQVQAALNGLGPIAAGGGSVTVTDGPGDAGGHSPYLVSFDGGPLAGTDQPLLVASNGAAPLSGGGATATVYTTNPGATGFEVCDPASGDECRTGDLNQPQYGGALQVPIDMALNQTSGDLYVNDAGGGLNRISQFSADGHFIRAWGWDVVAAGPDDSNADEQEQVTVNADGGTFKLDFDPGSGAPQTTAPIPYNASAAQLQSALDALSEIGGDQSSVTVTGGPGDLGGTNPYVITFHGLLGGDDVGGNVNAVSANASLLTASAGTPSASVSTITDGGGFEACTVKDACKAGANPFGSNSSKPGAFGGLRARGIAVAPAGAPNAGDVLVSDAGNNRVEEFTANGAFVRMFGWDVVASGPDDNGTGFEVCVPANGDVCKAGTSGTGVGQFASPNGSTLRGVAEDASGAIYTAEGDGSSTGVGRRVQKFTPAGGQDLTPSLFGTNEVQTLTVNAAAGQFRLGAFEVDGTTGAGTFTEGSSTITNVTTATGAFLVGQPITNGLKDIPYGAYITAVGANTLTVSQPALFSISSSLTSNRLDTTPDLPFNATAAQVQSAINALPPIVAAGGSVTVSGASGGPYQVSFDGGHLARSDPQQLVGSQGTTPLSGGSGPGANTASVATTTPGGPGGTDINPVFGFKGVDSPRSIVIGPGGDVFVSRNYVSGDPCSDGHYPPPELRVQELDPSGAVVQTSDPCGGIRPQGDPVGGIAVPSSLSVNPLTGHPYLLDIGDPGNGATPRLAVFGAPGSPPTLSLDPSLTNISSTGATISGTIDPNGPGESYPGATGVPSSYRTTYRVEYKKSTESEWTQFNPDTPIGSGTSDLPFAVGVSGLDPKTPYDLRVVATKPLTQSGVVEDEKSFTTLGAPPLINAFRSSGVTVNSADLHALINPQGTDTSYHFEYGTTTNYDHSTPEVDIGESLNPQAVTAHITGLADTTYHFRVVATNSLGTTDSEDQTFVFHPPACPNQTLRQQTGASYLPDCRAYELVSPEDAGGTTLYTGGPQRPYATSPSRLAFVGQFGQIPGAGATPINNGGDLYVATRGATGWSIRYVGLPASQAGCMGGRPAVTPFSSPTTIQNDVMASLDLGRLIDWNLGNPLECVRNQQGDLGFGDLNTAAQGSNSPYEWSANGDLLARWPTDLGSVSGAATNFACPQDPNIHPYPAGYDSNIPVSYFCSTNVAASGDLNHFVFSTQSGLFGGGGITQAPGSAYDDDTGTGTLSLISVLPESEGGGPIGQDPDSHAGSEELIQFPHVSSDGSRILMGTAVKPPCKLLQFRSPICPLISQPTHLYLRVDDAVTYDVSADSGGVGRAVTYVDSTPDGTRVYFTTKLQMTADDTDHSTDLYMWDENGGSPTLTRLSSGDAPAGNTDNCVATWTTNCDVKVYESSAISSVDGNKGGLGGWTYNNPNPNPGYTDNSVAAKAGDIYFYSPEQLVSGKGIPGRENVYVYHDGAVHFVVALKEDPYCIDSEQSDFFMPGVIGACSDGPLGRLQVTPDGRFAAFVTTSKITAYDNAGHAEMYRYDADSGAVQCMSCNPDGSPPSSDVFGSMGGRFITDDGRVFFDTEEALDPRDSNGAKDAYEFVDGRPQLITTGTGIGATGFGITEESVPGLYGVSADGTDAYFGTYETLVGQDRNGSGQLKFYDARVNGGFPFNPPPPPCVAADECHGPSSEAPGAPANGTGAALGSGGNYTAPTKAKHRKRHHKHRKRKYAHKRHRAGAGR